MESTVRKASKDNGNMIIQYIKAHLKQASCYTDDDETFLKKVKSAIDNGDIAKNRLKVIAQEAKKTGDNPLRFLQLIKSNITDDMLIIRDNKNTNKAYTEVILSEYLLRDSE